MADYEDVNEVSPRPYREPMNGTVIVTVIVYALHSVCILAGIASAGIGSVAAGFVFSGPAILAVILNYVFRRDAVGTYLETHFRWQIRTFWLTVGWGLLLTLLGMLLSFVGIGFALLFIGIPILGIWVTYRIALGWLRLFRNQPMPI